MTRPGFPTRTGLLPLLCAMGLHWPRRVEPDPDPDPWLFTIRQVCQRCGAYRPGWGDLDRYRQGREDLFIVRRWTNLPWEPAS